MMSDCTNEDLNNFSKEHYTYINQIFGDETVREIISEIFPNRKLEFSIEDTGEDFENSKHHVLINKKTGETICSVNSGYQNIFINKNDTLCQSYSLLTYFNINIDPDQKQRQMDMIKMYRKILSNKKFIRILDEIITHPDNYNLWTDYTDTDNTKYIAMNKDEILQKINDVLNKWENYGYWYFIGEGECPSTDTSPKKRRRIFGGKKKTMKNKTIKKKTSKRKIRKM